MRTLVINTGGTFSMLANSWGELIPGPTHKLEQALRSLLPSVIPSALLGDEADNHFLVDVLEPYDQHGQSLPPIDSSAISGRYWDAIGHTVLSEAPKYDGFIILHGTDTMAYSSAALRLMLLGFAKPVLITGSQRPLGMIDTDAAANFCSALLDLRRYWQNQDHNAVESSVGLHFAGQTFQADAVQKTHSHADVAFSGKLHAGFVAVKATVAHEPAQISVTAAEPNNAPNSELHSESTSESKSEAANAAPQSNAQQGREAVADHAATRANLAGLGFVEHVLDISITPQMTTAQLQHMLCAPDVEAAVLRLFGGGTAPAGLDFSAAVATAQARTGGRFKCLVVVSACAAGGLALGRYAAGRSAARSQSSVIIDGGRATTEAALVRLMWSLAAPNRAIRDASW